MKHVSFFFSITLFMLFISSANTYAQIKWDGGAATSNWSDALNWVGDVVPASTDSVVLDNSSLSGTYSVILPSTAVTTVIKRVTITPDSPNIITLTLPSTNTANPGITFGDGVGDAYDLTLNPLAVFINQSGAAGGSGITFVNSVDSMWIANGATYIHRTTRAQTGITNKLSKKTGTETGLFVYDMPTVASAVINFSNITYGSLTLSGASSGTLKKYITTNASACKIRGNFTIEASAYDSTVMTNSIQIGGNFTNNGYIKNSPTSTQTFIFNGTSEQLISGSDTTNFVYGLTINSGSIVTLNANIPIHATYNLTTPHTQTFTVNGTLNCGTNIVSGIGNFTLASGSTLKSGSVDGITASGTIGSIQNSGTRTLPVMLKVKSCQRKNKPIDYLFFL